MTRNPMIRKFFFSLALPICAATVAAQNATPAPANGAARHEPCWQQAGVQKSLMVQLASIQREAHTQADAVCSNASLTPQQKHQQVKEIHEQAFQKMSGLVTPDQRKALLECREERAANHSNSGGRGAGGCGGMMSGARPGGNPGTQSESGNSPSESQSSPQN